MPYCQAVSPALETQSIRYRSLGRERRLLEIPFRECDLLIVLYVDFNFILMKWTNFSKGTGVKSPVFRVHREGVFSLAVSF